MTLADDCADVNAVDFSYPFLAGIDLTNPPAFITIPAKYLDAMGNMERQYWEIKARRYNVLIFFKKGKFYELYDHDAVIANKEFGLKMVFDTSNRGKMRLAGVPEQSLSEWARLFVFRGYKVGRVEQMMKSEDDSPSAAKAKIVPRELVEVLTPGTLTDPAMLSDHQEVFLLALAPLPHEGVIDAFAIDLSRHVVHWCPCGDAVAVKRFRERCRHYASGGTPLGTSASQESAEVAADGGSEEEAVAADAADVAVAMRAVTTLLQQLHPREIIMATTAGRGATVNEKLLVRAADDLARWVQAEGYGLEAIPVPVSTVPTAEETTAHYLRSLKLDRELPLLREATLYDAHIASLAAANTSTAAYTPQARREGEPGSVLAWERRCAPGLVLDAATVGNLEIIANSHDGSERHSLHECLNGCITNGGKRLFRAWVLRPSASAEVIGLRQEVVRFFLHTQLASSAELWGRPAATGAGTIGTNTSSQASVTTHCSASEERGVTLTPGLSPSPIIAGPQGTPSLKRPREVSGASRARGDGSGSGQPFSTRFANMLAVDFERSLSRLAEIKYDDQHQTISYVDPLVKYRKSLSIILGAVQAFREMVEWATLFHAACRRQASRSVSLTRSQAAAAAAAVTRDSGINGVGSASGSTPTLLEELLYDIEAAATSVTAMEQLFDRRAADETGLLTPAPGTSAMYDAAVERLAAIEAKLHDHRRRAQVEVFASAPVGFVDIGKDLFLLEVATSDAPEMTPPGMVERARSGKSVKYVVTALESLVREHKEATAAKSAALLTVLQSVAARICEHCPVLYAATSALSYLDCLLNLARLPGRFPNMCFPDIVESEGECEGKSAAASPRAFLQGTDLVHPVLAAAAGGGGAAPVPNSIALNATRGHLLVLTGPNMAGKSTLMRTVASAVIMAQLGGPVLATGLRLAPVTRIFTRIGARDATNKGQSTLFVELAETAEILRAADGRSLCLIDELGRGTSTHDGLAIAHATLQALQAGPTPPLTIFSTHYHSLAQEQARRSRGVDEAAKVTEASSSSSPDTQLGFMDFALTGGSSSSGDPCAGVDDVPSITFLYRLVAGICDRSYGVEVAWMAGVSPALIALARDKSAELATLTALHEDLKTVQMFLSPDAGDS